jgi:hypothetical protein
VQYSHPHLFERRCPPLDLFERLAGPRGLPPATADPYVIVNVADLVKVWFEVLSVTLIFSV